MPADKDSLKGFVDLNNTSQHAADSVMNRYFVGFPYSLPSQNGEYVSGIEDITDWVRNGYSSLYSRDGMPGYSFYTDGSGRVYRVSDAENINTSGMSPLSYGEMRKRLPGREYIGGKDYRFRTAQRIPGFLDKIKERAEAYGIDPNLVLNRILHEGWIDQQVINYNGLDASQQGGYWNGLWDAPVSGYGSFGLDYAGSNLMNGVYELKDPDASWREAEFTDYEGGKGFRVGTSLEADNLSSAIEILAAELAYRQGEVAKKYGKKDSDLNVWTNAAFNMGLNHKDLKKDDWVRSQYTYPDYYGQMETQKKLGGIMQRYGADKLQQYFASGGSIHIKPSHRGRLTELKKRTDKSEAELYANGSPSVRKMITFARNSRKWKHADGGLLRRFDDGTPGEVVSPDWNWQDTMYSYQSPDVAESDVVIPYATDDILSEIAVVLPEQETPKVTKQIGRTHNIERGNLLQEIEGASSSIQRDSFLSSSVPAILPATPIEVNLDADPVTVPQRDTASYFATTASRLVDEANRFNAKGKTRDEIIAIQRELADAGYYSGYLSGKSKDEIKAIQTKLINKGLLSNRKKSDGTYAEADGVVGERTKAAWNQYNVDGKWGARSDEAYKTRNRMQGNGNDNKWENDFREGVDGCARWVTQKYESVLGNVSGQNGVFGNAWQMPKNIVRKGGTMLFNLYDEGFNGVRSTSDLKQRTKSRLSKNKPDLSVLQPGDVVGIFFPNSSHHGDVLREGTTYNTHVGIIVAYDNDGTPIVQHNMGGDERKDRADKLPWGSQITVAARPATSGAMDTYPWKMGESKYKVELPEKFENMATEENKAKLKTYMDSMAGGADVIGGIYTNADMDAVQRIAIGVLGRETGFMQNTESSRTGKAGARVKAEKLIRSIVRDENPETKSSDLTKFKLSNLSPNERAFLGITSAQDLEKPEKAGLASMYVLAKNYDYFVRYAKENPQLGLTKQDIEDLTALSYNQGMSKLYQVGTVEFGGERRVAPSILESIREAASSDEEIDDFSATKLGRVAHEYPMLTGLMREMYNHGMGNRSSSYMNAARQAIQSIKAKR